MPMSIASSWARPMIRMAFPSGIADWCDLNKTFKFWEDELSKHVYELIPQRFSRISIFHSD